MTIELRPPDEPLVGDGVQLRLWRIGDADQVAAICADPEIPRWTLVPVGYTRADAESFIQHSVEYWHKNVAGAFCVAGADDADRVIGAIGVHLRQPDIGHIGYWVAAEARGRGVATAALRLLCRWSFAAGFPRLELQIIPGNDGSAIVAERVGFKEEGLIRQSIDQRGVRRDGRLFSLLPGELLG
jgi:RimJ/RimL family protein N-acetyltransferase